MILTGEKIRTERDHYKIHIQPFNKDHLGANSYDLRLSKDLFVYQQPESGEELVLDAAKKTPPLVKMTIPEVGLVLQPNCLYLGTTVEEAGSSHYVPMIEGRSSMGRLGLKVHVTAGFGDLGFKNQWTLELEVTHPVRVYANMRVCQVYFHTVDGGIDKLYVGKYLNAKGVSPSLSHLDFA